MATERHPLILYSVSALLLLTVAIGLSAEEPGDERWRFESAGKIISSPSVGDNGTIYFGSRVGLNGENPGGRIYAVNPDGTIKWEFAAADWIDSSPTIGPDGTLYVGSFDNNLYSIDSVTGIQNWKFETGSLIFASPSVDKDGDIYFGSFAGFFYALDSNGTQKWVFPTTDVIDSSPAIDLNGVIYFGSGDGRLHALNPDGTLRWEYVAAAGADGENQITSSPAIDSEGNILFSSHNRSIISLSPTGLLNWSFETGDKIDSSPIIGPEGTIYIASRDGFLYSLDENGVEQWAVEIGTVFFSSPAIDNEGNAYVASSAGGGLSRLFSLDSSGNTRWQLDLSTSIDSSPSISNDGVLYLGGFDGNLYAVYAGIPLANSAWPKFKRDPMNSGMDVLPDPPVVATQPQSLTRPVGSSVTLEVDVLGYQPLSFQWFKDVTPLSGETTSSLSLTNLQFSDSGTYSVSIVNNGGSAVSEDAVLTVADSFWVSALDLGQGWRQSDWLGLFNVKFDPWIFHLQHGWLFTSAVSIDNIWFYALDMGWLWTSSSLYPSLYRHSDGAWLFYLVDSTNPRWFSNLSSNEWETSDP